MALLDHLGITVDDVPRAAAQFGPVLEALGYTRHGTGEDAYWIAGAETEIILYPAREAGSGPHRHGRVGWQHLAFAVATRTAVDDLHAVALAAGWSAVREPKEYPRYTERYYASFVENVDGIRIEFMFNPPREA